MHLRAALRGALQRATLEGTVGVVPFSYYELFEHDLRPLEIWSPETSRAALEAANVKVTPTDPKAKPPTPNPGEPVVNPETTPWCVFPSQLTITNGSYPLARPTYVYTTDRALKRPEVKAFLEAYVNESQDIAQREHLVAVGDDLLQANIDTIDGTSQQTQTQTTTTETTTGTATVPAVTLPSATTPGVGPRRRRRPRRSRRPRQGPALSCGAMSGSTISFARGAPSLDIIDVEGLRAAADRAFTNDPGGATAYGTSVGYPPLRRWLAARHGVAESQVLLTNGSMQADAFLFDELVSPGTDVVIEKPSYDRTIKALAERGAVLHPVTLEPDGIDVDELGALIAGGVRPSLAHIIPNFQNLAHIIPNFQNPAGYTISLAKRERLLALAGEHGFTIFEDDPYVAIRYRGEALPTMLELDGDGTGGRVVYASSFSKTVCPGIRVGYLVGSPEIIARIADRATGTYISPNMVAQAIVHEFCVGGGLERSIATVKAALAQRVDALTAALAREIPEARFVAPDGGYFMWVELPEGTRRRRAVRRRRRARGSKGTDFLVEGGENTLRLAYSGVTPEEIEEGVGRLAEALRSLPTAA